MKGNWLFGIGVAIVVALLFLVESGSADKQDWTRSYSRKDKIPFGTYIFFNLVGDVFPGQTVTPQDQNLFDYLRKWRYGNESEAQRRFREQMRETEAERQRRRQTDPDSVPAYDSHDPYADDYYYSDEDAYYDERQEEAYPHSDYRTPEAILPPVETPEAYRIEVPDHSPTDAQGRPRSNYLLFVEEFKPDYYVTEDLLEYVRQGNNVFIATSALGGPLADSLRTRIAYDRFVNFDIDQEYDTSGFMGMFYRGLRDSMNLRFISPTRDSLGNFRYRSVTLQGSFTRFDSARAEVLMVNSQLNATTLRYRYGAGYLYVCSTPLVFTNYSMATTPNQALPAQLLSYMPNRPVLWDDYLNRSVAVSGSLLRYVFANEGLRWGWYVLIITTLLYVFFLGKRRQKPIPVIVPPRNTAVEFAETIGRLYFQSQDHRNIADKRIQFLLEHIRTHFYIPTDKLDAVFYERLSGRTGIPVPQIKTLFTVVKHIQLKAQITEQELSQLNILIEEFHHRTNR